MLTSSSRLRELFIPRHVSNGRVHDPVVLYIAGFSVPFLVCTLIVRPSKALGGPTSSLLLPETSSELKANSFDRCKSLTSKRNHHNCTHARRKLPRITITQATMSSTTGEPIYRLHGFYRSSCSARARIALNLKDIPYTQKFVDVPNGAHHTPEHRAINPMGFIPALEIITNDNTNNSTNDQSGTVITPSLSILEYLEETHPHSRPLLPPATKPLDRAHVRALSALIACDIQPVTNDRILKKVNSIDGSGNEWAAWLMHAGFAAYEALASGSAGKFSCGDEVTLADVCLVPAVWRAETFGVGLEGYPTMKRVYEEMMGMEGVQRAHWRRQEDCPVELRE